MQDNRGASPPTTTGRENGRRKRTLTRRQVGGLNLSIKKSKMALEPVTVRNRLEKVNLTPPGAPGALKIAPKLPGSPGGPGGVKISPGDPRDHF